jgi:hypothetical protein
MRFFFYGTLLDEDVRRAVLGKLAPVEIEPARLAGWRRFSLEGVSFPIARPDRTSFIDGLLVRGLSPEAGRLLDIYEGVGYARREVKLVSGVSAILYVEDGSRSFTASPLPWDLDVWVRRHKKAYLALLAKSPQSPR